MVKWLMGGTEAVGGKGAAAILILRLVAGLAFIQHGWPKIQHPFGWMGPEATVPGFLQALAALSEFGGGFALLLGLLTRLAALGIACTMLFAIFMVHLPKGDPFVGRGGSSYELAAVYLAIMAVLLLRGAGGISLDALLCRKKG
jgi:putative oxidoreductase